MKFDSSQIFLHRQLPTVVLGLIVATTIAPCSASAQSGIVDCIEQNELVVTKVAGSVVDPSGVPVPKAQVWLSQDEKLIAKQDTDSLGRFELKTEPGTYTLKAQSQGFEVTRAELNVGKDISSFFHPTALKVILALPGMNCPWVTTSNREYKELVQRHATQK